jgi:hypothetical protein
MTEAARSSGEQGHVSVVPYALFVPVLVVMAQSAWVVQGWDFRYNALLAHVYHPVILGGMAVLGVISFFVIRPFARRTLSRWVAFLACVVGFTILIEMLLPKLAV